jgi:hypothetical protein
MAFWDAQGIFLLQFLDYRVTVKGNTSDIIT